MASRLLYNTGRRHLLFRSRRMVIVAPVQQRFLSSSSSEPPKWKQPGTLSIWLGWSIVALLVIDQGLQYQQSQAKRKFFGEVKAYRDPPDDADHYEWLTRETLFTCKIKRVPEMDGYKSLKGVQVGDVVEVVEERAGPEDEYSVCRIQRSNEVSVGWFPTVDLERVVEEVETKQKKKPWYKIW